MENKMDPETGEIIPPTSQGDGKKDSLKHTGSLTGAFILIVIGIIFLLDNAWGIKVGNWWALLILIPAIAAFSRAWSLYKNKGRFNPEAASSLTGGLILSLVAFIFLFSLDWGKVWPAFLVVIGLGALIGALSRR